MSSKRKGKPEVRVTWHDSFTTGHKHFADGFKSCPLCSKPFVVESVGFLIEKGRKNLVVAQSRTAHREYWDPITIPRSWIQEIHYYDKD